jgi:hypothetical protein
MSIPSSLDTLKRELGRLSTFTDEIGKAKDSAVQSRQAAEAAIQAAEAVHAQQQALLADLQREHQKSIDGQSAILRANSEQWVRALDKQLALALESYGKQTQQLEKVATTLRTDGQKQSDVLQGMTDRLQVITASLTAFRDAMNAAKFSDRLESIDTQQQTIKVSARETHTAIVERLTALEEQVKASRKWAMVFQGVVLLGILGLLVLQVVK